MSIRQKIEDILKETPNISIGELRNRLPEINAGSLKAEFYKHRGKLTGPVKIKKPIPKLKEKSVQQQVNEYLSKNPEISAKTMQDEFPNIKPKSLSAYKSMWKKKQLEKPAVKQTGKPAEKLLDKSEKLQPDKVAQLIKKTGSDDTELIDSLKNTIDAQRQTIDALKKTTELMTPEINEEELKGMTFSDIKRIAVTFLKSIRDLPDKLRR